MYSKRLRIAIDARYLSHNLLGGVHTYVSSLTATLLTSEQSYDFDLWLDDKAPFDFAQLPEGSRVRTLPWRSTASSLRNDFRLGMFMRRAGADVVHFPANYGFAPPGVPTVVTLHDAINLLPLREIIRGHEKKPRTMAMMSYLHQATRLAVRRQPLVITVSQHARQEILRNSDLEPERVRVVYSAADDAFRVLDEDVVRQERERLQLRARVLVADAIKNPETTIRAYRQLPGPLRSQTSLVFFSRREPNQNVKEAANSGDCIVFQQPPTELLVTLFNLADVFVFPSYYEGFGLPALEAMACGTPVVGSSVGSIPEIVADAGTIVPDANDHSAFSAAIESILNSREVHCGLRARALDRAATFSWKRTAQDTLDAYLTAVRSTYSGASRARDRVPASA